MIPGTTSSEATAFDYGEKEFDHIVHGNERIPLFALVVGINDYQTKHKLAGAVADADAFSAYLLDDLSIPNNQITNLRDKDATRVEIIRSLKSLQTNPSIKYGDAIVVYYAGHGSNIKASPGWDTASPGWDTGGEMIQALVPQDAGLTGGSNTRIYPIPDRTIAALLNELADAKGDNITVIFDCCHSASGTREDENAPGRIARAVDTSDVGPLPSNLDFEILACGSDELAYETNARGDYTQALLAVLKAVDANKLTYKGCMHRLPSLPKQNPHCEGHHVNRFFFNAKAAGASRRFISIDSDSDIIILRAGVARGVTAFRSDEARVGFTPVESEELAQLIINTDESGRRATFVMHHGLSNSNGISTLPYTTSTRTEDLLPVLRAAAQWRWHVDRTNPNRPFNKSVDMQFFRLNDGVETSQNLNTGVVHIKANTDQVYGIKLVNHSTRHLYPYLFYFDASGLAIEEYYLGSTLGNSTATPPLPRGSSLTIGYGSGGQTPFQYVVDEEQGVDVGIIKLFVTTSPTEFDSLAQESPFDGGRGVVEEKTVEKLLRPRDEWDTISMALLKWRGNWLVAKERGKHPIRELNPSIDHSNPAVRRVVKAR
ncbi:hypothetical protein RSAG8_06594, partial [Rhizoctonia solani AG-8 WAC10335]